VEHPDTSKKRQLALLLAVFFAGSMWFYVQRILIPYQQTDAVAHGRPRGNLSDLYPRWLGARELLLHHRSPYSAEVTREIQVGYYGRILDADRVEDPKDQQGFAYPVYVVFFLAPTIFFSFAVVKFVFGWFLVVLTGISVFLWLRALQWKPPAATLAILLLLTLGCFPFAQGIKLQQLTLLVCGLIAGCAVLIVGDQLLLAGILLAAATIKPQIVVLLILWLLLWVGSDWRNRKRLFLGFSLAMLALLVGAQAILPGWFGQFRSALAAYRQYTGGGGSVLETLSTPVEGKLLAALLVLGLAALCWKTRHALANSPQFSCTMALVLTVTLTVIPMTAPYNQLLLLPAIYLIVRNNNFFPRKNPLLLVLSSTCILLILWPWLAASGLSLASCALPATTVQRAWAAPLYTSLAIPPAVVALLIPNILTTLRRSPATS
jgi:hypothetical protein